MRVRPPCYAARTMRHLTAALLLLTAINASAQTKAKATNTGTPTQAIGAHEEYLRCLGRAASVALELVDARKRAGFLLEATEKCESAQVDSVLLSLMREEKERGSKTSVVELRKQAEFLCRELAHSFLWPPNGWSKVAANFEQAP